MAPPGDFNEGGEAWVVDAASSQDSVTKKSAKGFAPCDPAITGHSLPRLARSSTGCAPATRSRTSPRSRRNGGGCSAAGGDGRIDFFHATERDEVEALMSTIERLIGPEDKKPSPRRRATNRSGPGSPDGE